MKTIQQTLPGVRDFRKPVECRGRELSDVIAQAKAAGYYAHRMTVLPDVNYRLQFFPITDAAEPLKTAPEKIKESFFRGV
jgi:hypothetical protein